MKTITLSDPTLRDGNHAVKHQLTAEQIKIYATAANTAGLDIVEIGHGCGLGGSSLQFGFSPLSDREMLKIGRAALSDSLLGVHIIPGIGRKKDVEIAIEEGVDVFRVGGHCTEASITQSMMNYINRMNKQVFGALMMIHMVDEKKLFSEAKKLADYGASAVILMDSAGALLPAQVENRVAYLVENLSIRVGFHAHNNLGLAVANSLAAANAGATIIDGTARGFGAGAGNTPIEHLISILQKANFLTRATVEGVFTAADIAEKWIISELPKISSHNISSGLYGVFSGFSKHVEKISKDFKINPLELYRKLGERNVIAGQEDVILEIASGSR